MSRIVYFDCASGASGDMLLGAVVDLGLPIDRLREELAKLPLPGYRIEARGVTRSGLAATKVDVVAEGPSPAHRHLRHILELLEASALEAEVKARAAALFRRLAEAEAAVHGTSVEKVHFHEVGAVDSIVDIVGGVIALRWLAARRFVASPLNVGTGTVTMSHGTFPVPPPATAKLVAGVPVYGEGEGELLTPTGALLVTAHATEYGPLPPMRIESTGHGAGGRETKGRPNVLRLIVGEEAAAPGPDRVLVLETELDDAVPQLLGPLLDRLLAHGALDAFFTPVQMKKGRPGVLVTVIAEAAKREALEELLFRETTTLGVRRQEWDRTVLEREMRRGRDRLRADPCQDRPPRRDDLQRVARVRRLPAGGRREGCRGEGGPRRRPRRVARGQPWEPMSTSKRVSVITTPIYYVNDVPHVGHAYTTIAADTLARARRLSGQDVFFLTGTDEHGQNIERIARERGISEQEHCDLISAAFRSLWDRYDIRYDRFIRTTEDVHRRGVLKLWALLRAAKTPDGRDAVYLGKYSGWYCPRCESFKDEEELLQPDNVCPDHERPCEWTEEENFFFRLSAYEDWLRETIESDRLRIRPDSRKNELLGVIKQGLKDLSVSRARVKWGIPVPEQPDHVLYVWVDALSNYITALGFADDGEAYRHYWAGGDERLHLIGKDIIRFHGLYWPAILHAAGVPVPTREFAQGFITRDGRKLSKTTGNVIDPVALVERLGPDAARYFVLREAPYGSDWDFTDSAFVGRYNADLANDLGNLVSRALTMVVRYCDGKVPPRWEPPVSEGVGSRPGRGLHRDVRRFRLRAARRPGREGARPLRGHRLLLCPHRAVGLDRAVQPGHRPGRAVVARQGPGAPRRARGLPLPAARGSAPRGRARLARHAARGLAHLRHAGPGGARARRGRPRVGLARAGPAARRDRAAVPARRSRTGGVGDPASDSGSAHGASPRQPSTPEEAEGDPRVRDDASPRPEARGRPGAPRAAPARRRAHRHRRLREGGAARGEDHRRGEDPGLEEARPAAGGPGQPRAGRWWRGSPTPTRPRSWSARPSSSWRTSSRPGSWASSPTAWCWPGRSTARPCSAPSTPGWRRGRK